MPRYNKINKRKQDENDKRRSDERKKNLRKRGTDRQKHNILKQQN